MVGETCLPSNAYYLRTPDYTLYSGVHVCWSEYSDSSFVYGFMSLDYGFGTMTATTFNNYVSLLYIQLSLGNIFTGISWQHCLPSVHFVAALLNLSVFPFGAEFSYLPWDVPHSNDLTES